MVNKMIRAYVVLAVLSISGAALVVQDSAETLEIEVVHEENNWSEMDRKGAACKAMVWTIHRTSMQDLELIAQALVRAKEEGPTQLERRALLAIGIDIDKILATEGPELDLWRVVADPTLPMPAMPARFSSDLTDEGLGRVQDWIPVTDFPDSWDNHPDHLRRPHLQDEEE